MLNPTEIAATAAVSLDQAQPNQANQTNAAEPAKPAELAEPVLMQPGEPVAKPLALQPVQLAEKAPTQPVKLAQSITVQPVKLAQSITVQPAELAKPIPVQPAQVEYSFWRYLNPLSYFSNNAASAKTQVAQTPQAPLQIQTDLPVTNSKNEDSPIIVVLSPKETPKAAPTKEQFPQEQLSKEQSSQEKLPKEQSDKVEPPQDSNSVLGAPPDQELPTNQERSPSPSPEPGYSDSPWVYKPLPGRTFASVVAGLKKLNQEQVKMDENAPPQASAKKEDTQPGTETETGTEIGTKAEAEKGIAIGTKVNGPAPLAEDKLTSPGTSPSLTGTSPILVLMPPPSPGDYSPTVETAYKMSKTQRRRAARRKGREKGMNAKAPSI